MPASSPFAHPSAARLPAGVGSDALDRASCYRAMAAHDARFDGVFFTGVTSTGIYCRPVCRVRVPKLANCCFFTFAAQAEALGFRPCLRCRPELAPGGPGLPAWSMQDASAVLLSQAMHLLDQIAADRAAGPDSGTHSDAHGGSSIVQIAAMKLGVSERHLRRIFEARIGISPLQMLLTSRLLAAKQLLTDTALPMAEVAAASGFGSLRRFNAAFRQHYGMSPSRLRPAASTKARLLASHQATGKPADAARTDQAAITVRLGYRPPYHVAAMMDFLRAACGARHRRGGAAGRWPALSAHRPHR